MVENRKMKEKFIATCKIGLESLTAQELRQLNIEVEQVLDARVIFRADFFEMAKACLWLRTAERVLLVVSEFKALSFEELFEGVRKIDWTRYLSPDNFIHVNGKSAKSKLFSVSDCQSITKKAIIESLKQRYKLSYFPENGKRIIIEVGLLRDIATIALDCCGAGLSRRGYRTYNVPAPISETLGAAIVLLSGYNADRPLIDPTCGSGTMPIEAAMIAKNIAVGMNRKFSAEDWHFINSDAFSFAREHAHDSIKDVPVDILGSDIDPRCIDVCKKHAQKAGVIVNWAVKPLQQLNESRKGGVLVCNPPYGERLLEKREAEKLYKQMHDVFSQLNGWSVNIIASHPDFERIYGKRADKRRKLSNGGMTCTLYKFFPQYRD